MGGRDRYRGRASRRGVGPPPGGPDRDRGAEAAAAAARATALPETFGEHWWERRTDAAGTFRRVMGEERMLGPGAIIDTVEVCGLWSVLPRLYTEVRDALAEHAARPVGTHLSHPHRSGASMTFTVLLHGRDDQAREALEGGTRFLVAVGGDGTIQEVINGMLEDGRPVAGDAVLGVVAAGSGSDFVRTFGLPGDTVKAVRHLQGDRLYPIGVIRAEYRLDDEVVTRFVVNVAECGLGAAVVRRAARLPRWLGRSRYFWGFWLSLGPYRPSVVRVRVDRKEFEGTANNVVVANCQFYGGGVANSPPPYPGGRP